jgi:O-antigen biosynthesis protein
MEQQNGPAIQAGGERTENTGADGASDRYAREIDLSSDSTHARVVRLTGTDRRVLELGPGTGHMTRVLRERGCTVIGIEVDPAMAEEARADSERVIVGDLDQLDLDAELEDDRFDTIVAADVLEHLKDPLSALQRLRAFLRPGGHFVISLPNVAHGSVRLALLQGHFDYQNVGLLDTTHLRFFTRESIGALLDEAELAVVELFHQHLNLDASEVPFDRDRVPADVLDALSGDPEARTYQFVIKAAPLDTPGLRDLQRQLRDLAHENAVLQAQVADQSNRHGGQVQELREALIRAHDQVLRRDEEIHRLQEELQSARLFEEEATRLRVRLERIVNSPPGRAYAVLSTLPILKGVRAARTGDYERALRSAGGPGTPGA